MEGCDDGYDIGCDDGCDDGLLDDGKGLVVCCNEGCLVGGLVD